jgi:tRNA (guanine9-N1)-methyltransferase
VNQVFEILLKWVETRDWEEALHSVIPKRKFQGGATARSDDTTAIAHADGGDGGNEGGKIDDVDAEPTILAEEEQASEEGVPGHDDR